MAMIALARKLGLVPSSETLPSCSSSDMKPKKATASKNSSTGTDHKACTATPAKTRAIRISADRRSIRGSLP